ncbi:hypothetical protein [Aliikangiella sp. IMCC44359]|uniref:hypothetical protein n=1 Tax=Aliikangiella sp. IMCC44359 TaxID=3459125 RepID=UPI00403B154C
MIEGQYDVIFRGQIVKSFELSDVKANLVKLFKSTPEAVERLFSGSEVTIRKGLDYAAAMKYQSALRNAGALALIKEVEAEKESPPPIQEIKKTATTSNIDSSNTTPADRRDTTESQSIRASNPEAADDSEGLTMAQVGAQILPPKVYEQRDVDTSDLSLAKAGERILPEKEPEKHAQPSIDHLSLTDN